MRKLAPVLSIIIVLSLSLLFTACKKNEVVLAPTACFTVNNQNVKTRVAVLFSNCSANAKSYEWDFGDGSKSTEVSPSKSYTANGTYNVTLTAVNSEGVKATFQNTIVVKDCEQGYEGDDCTTESRIKFYGSYNATDNSVEQGISTYTATITSSPANIYSISINNLWDFFLGPVTATVSGNNFTIPLQDPDNDGYTVTGSGSVSNNTISISFKITHNTDEVNVTGTWIK